MKEFINKVKELVHKYKELMNKYVLLQAITVLAVLAITVFILGLFEK